MKIKTSITYLMIHVPYSSLSLAYIRYSIEQIVKSVERSHILCINWGHRFIP